jgi:hypothetical protein
MNVLQKMLLASKESLVSEFPLVSINLSKSISVKLSDEAGEIVVFEIPWKYDSGKL